MAEPRPDPDGEPSPTTGAPVWLNVVGIIALVLVVLFVVMMLAGGTHGPGLHSPPSP